MITEIKNLNIYTEEMNEPSDKSIESVYTKKLYKNTLVKIQCQLGIIDGMTKINNYIKSIVIRKKF